MHITPRPLMRAAFVAVGVAVGQVAWVALDLKLLAYLAGLCGPFGMLCLSAVWAMRDKADAYLAGDDLDADTFELFRTKATEVRDRAMAVAASTGVAVILAAGPAISHQLLGSIWQWMTLLSGAAAAHCAYSFLLASEWERQLRAFRQKYSLMRKREHEREELLARMAGDQPGLGGPVGWVVSPDSLTAEPNAH